MLRLRFVLVMILISALVGCEKDLEYDVQSPEAAMVVNSIFAKDSIWQIEVSTNADPGQGTQIKILKDARVFIFEDGVRISDIVLDSINVKANFLGAEEGGRTGSVKLFIHRTQTSTAKAGRNYELRVSHPLYPTVYSTTVVPRPARVQMTNASSGVATMIGNVNHSRLSYKIIDDGTENYYGIEVWVRKQEVGAQLQRIGFYSQDAVLSENLISNAEDITEYSQYAGKAPVFFSNKTFRGRQQDFSVWINSNYFLGSSEVFVRVLRLSPELYDFAVSYQKQLINQSNPFAEPAQVFSNIQNGYGIFAGYSETDLRIR